MKNLQVTPTTMSQLTQGKICMADGFNIALGLFLILNKNKRGCKAAHLSTSVPMTMCITICFGFVWKGTV